MGAGTGKEKVEQKAITVLHVTVSLGIGGAEAVLCSLIENLQEGDIKHAVITFRDGPYADRIRACGVPVYSVHGAWFRYDLVFWVRLVRLVKQINPDCLHCLLWAANCSGRIIGRLLGIPVVSGMHNNVVINGAFRNCIDKYTLPLSSRVVAIHEGVCQSIISRCNNHAQLPISVIHNCIDEGRVHAAAAANIRTRHVLRLTDDQFIIGAVGRLIPIKRYSLLIEQFARVHRVHANARLVLVGYGPEEKNLRALVAELDCVQEVLFIVNEQAFGYFPLFNCFVLPSLTEGPSIALLEAMSFGLPCVVTHDENTHPVIKDDYNGCLVPAYDEESLGNSLIKLIEDKALRDRLGVCAQNTVRSQFSVNVMATKYKECFTEAVTEKSVLHR